MLKKINKSLITGLLFLVFSILYIYGSFFIKTTKRYKGIGAGFMPRIYGIILIICSIIQLVEGVRILLTDSKNVSITTNPKENKNKKNVILCFVLMISYVFLIRYIGYVICSSILMTCLCILLLPKNFKSSKKIKIYIFVFSVVLPLVTFLFFKYVMHVPLPIGQIFSL